MSSDEITVMRKWVTETATRLSALGPMPNFAEIAALPDERITEIVAQHFAGGLKVFRWHVRNGVDPS